MVISWRSPADPPADQLEDRAGGNLEELPMPALHSLFWPAVTILLMAAIVPLGFVSKSVYLLFITKSPLAITTCQGRTVFLLDLILSD